MKHGGEQQVCAGGLWGLGEHLGSHERPLRLLGAPARVGVAAQRQVAQEFLAAPASYFCIQTRISFRQMPWRLAQATTPSARPLDRH
jgi:hypothetical protein